MEYAPVEDVFGGVSFIFKRLTLMSIATSNVGDHVISFDTRRECAGNIEHTNCIAMGSLFVILTIRVVPSDSDWVFQSAINDHVGVSPTP